VQLQARAAARDERRHERRAAAERVRQARAREARAAHLVEHDQGREAAEARRERRALDFWYRCDRV